MDVMIEDARWAEVEIEPTAAKVLDAVLAHVQMDPAAVEVSVLACSDDRIAQLNSDFRGKPAPTNVLSWPSEALAADSPGADPRAPEPGPDGTYELGDVAIAYDTCAREATQLGKPMTEHATHLLVHGVLHLLGYDHIHDADAALMQESERKILGKMGIDDPY